MFHLEDGAQAPGPDPARGDDNSFLAFTDLDGNGWMVQQAGRSGAAAS